MRQERAGHLRPEGGAVRGGIPVDDDHLHRSLLMELQRLEVRRICEWILRRLLVVETEDLLGTRPERVLARQVVQAEEDAAATALPDGSARRRPACCVRSGAPRRERCSEAPSRCPELPSRTPASSRARPTGSGHGRLVEVDEGVREKSVVVEIRAVLCAPAAQTQQLAVRSRPLPHEPGGPDAASTKRGARGRGRSGEVAIMSAFQLVRSLAGGGTRPPRTRSSWARARSIAAAASARAPEQLRHLLDRQRDVRDALALEVPGLGDVPVPADEVDVGGRTTRATSAGVQTKYFPPRLHCRHRSPEKPPSGCRRSRST
jgi:hypothetical protein